MHLFQLRFDTYCLTSLLNYSKLKPELDAHGVDLAAVGFDDNGVDDFIDGKFFAGDLYLDKDRSCYKARRTSHSLPRDLLCSRALAWSARG